MSITEHLRNYDVILIQEGANESDIRARQRELPTDLHLVDYEVNGTLMCDAVRAPKKADVFDAYHDYEGSTVKDIRTGYGTLRPNMYGVTQKKSSSSSKKDNNSAGEGV